MNSLHVNRGRHVDAFGKLFENPRIFHRGVVISEDFIDEFATVQIVIIKLQVFGWYPVIDKPKFSEIEIPRVAMAFIQRECIEVIQLELRL